MARSSPALARGPMGAWARVSLRSGPGRAAWRVLSATLSLAVVGLVAFHVWLLWDQLLTGRLLDPGVALRWAAAALLVAALAWLRRSGVPLLHGRKALTVWLLVVLLHFWGASAPGSLDAQIGATAPDATALYVLPVTTGPLLVGVGLLLLAWLVGRPSASVLRGCAAGSRSVLLLDRLDDGPPLPGRAPPALLV